MPIPEIFRWNMRHRIVAVDESEHTPVGVIDDALAKYFIASPRTPEGIERSVAAAKTAHRKCRQGSPKAVAGEDDLGMRMRLPVVPEILVHLVPHIIQSELEPVMHLAGTGMKQ